MRKLSFIPGKTFLHRLYPLTKFTWLIIASILVFIINKGLLLLILAGTLFIILLMNNPRIITMRGFRLALITGLLLLLLHLLFDKSGSIIIDSDIKIISLTNGGLNSGLRISGRFLSIIFLSYIFILSTDPNHLAYAIMKTGIPYRYGFMLVTALRLAPLLEEEGRIIYQAQLARGVQYDRRSLGKQFLFVRQFLTPLILSAIQRADKLFFSLEGRGFGKYSTRTFRTRIKPSTIDITASIILVLSFTILIILDLGEMIPF